MAVVEVGGLTKHFNGVVAVDGVDIISISAEGEFLVLLGPSGCGKTTLLRMIAGLEEPTSSEIYISGRLVNGLPPRLRRIAMVFQSYAPLSPYVRSRQHRLPSKGGGGGKGRTRGEDQLGRLALRDRTAAEA